MLIFICEALVIFHDSNEIFLRLNESKGSSYRVVSEVINRLLR